VADERRVLFTGWHTDDTHAGPSNLHYGLDNWLYGIVGYAGFDGVVDGERHRFRQGFYRFKPDGSKMEFLRNTNNNSWGVGISEEGFLFGSTANGNPSVHVPISNRYYESVQGWSPSVLRGIAGNPAIEPITDRVRQVDYHGQFTAAAGHDLYTARAYPQEYWNRAAFVAEPTGHLLATFQLEPEGASFRSRMAWNLLASDDEWSAPIMGAVGPDGQVWVIDWYNYIVQHNPTPAGWKTGKGGAYETELRDKTHGRIYRVVYKAGRPYRPLTLQGASPEKLVDTLKNDNMFWRLHAQRLLVKRGKRDVVPALIELTSDRSVDAIGLNASVIHALWTLHGLGVLDGSRPAVTAAAVSALGHPSAGVRRNALQVLPRNADSVAAIIKAGSVADADPQVRLAALLALADMPASPASAGAVLPAVRNAASPQDRWLSDAACSASAANANAFLSLALRQEWKAPVRGNCLATLERVAEHYARHARAVAVGALLADLASAREPVSGAVIAGLCRGWPRDRPPSLDAQVEKALADLFPKLLPHSQGQVVELAARWHSKALDKQSAELAHSFRAHLRDETASDRDRVAAAVRLIELRPTDDDTVKQVLGLVTPQSSPDLARGLLDAVAQSEARSAGGALIGLLPSLTPGTRPAGLRTILGRSDWTAAFLDAVAAGKVPLNDLSLDQRQSLLAHPRRRIAARAKQLLVSAGSLPDSDRQKVIDELMPVTQIAGDAAAGKLVFKNTCAKCHAHMGEGARIGPDLTGMAVHPKSHLLAEILDPSRSVEGNYRQYVVTTKDGRVLSGLLSSETKTAVELLDVEGKAHTVLREDIEELHQSNKSLMPDGFEKQLSKCELSNLLEFLTRRGKYLPLPLEKSATAVSTRGMFYDEGARGERLVFEDWSPKMFQGVPFHLVDPHGDRVPNVILLYGPEGKIPPRMPKAVRLPCNSPAKAIHLLSGISGWGFPLGEKGSVSMIVRIHYPGGSSEDHALKNGVHFADYIRRVDVPQSQFAFSVGGRQIRYLAIHPGRKEKIEQLEFIKGPDDTAPIIVAATVETE
jgi:putative heme-binding domain-containing protein